MWKMMTSVQQGKGHIIEDIPCQDKTYMFHKNNVYVISLADGAGSARLSHLGASIVTQSIANHFVDSFEQIASNPDGVAVKKSIISFLQNKLTSLADQEKCEVKDLACTLLVVAIKDNRYIMCHVGDGVIGCIKNGKLIVASHPDNGEFINTTCFVTSSKVLQSFVLKGGLVTNISAFVMMSDGSAESFYSRSTKTLSNALVKISSWISLLDNVKMQEMLDKSFVETIIPRTMDDCSIAFLVNTTNAYKTLLSLDTYSIHELLGISQKKITSRRICRIKKLLSVLSTPLLACQIASVLGIHGPGRKHIHRLLNQIVASGVIVKKGPQYKLAIDDI